MESFFSLVFSFSAQHLDLVQSHTLHPSVCFILKNQVHAAVILSWNMQFVVPKKMLGALFVLSAKKIISTKIILANPSIFVIKTVWIRALEFLFCLK